MVSKDDQTRQCANCGRLYYKGSQHLCHDQDGKIRARTSEQQNTVDRVKEIDWQRALNA